MRAAYRSPEGKYSQAQQSVAGRKEFRALQREIAFGGELSERRGILCVQPLRAGEAQRQLPQLSAGYLAFAEEKIAHRAHEGQEEHGDDPGDLVFRIDF